MNRIEAPWTEAQCAALNAVQNDPNRHPYTCGNDSRHRPLIATRDGWRCSDCDYRQNWAHGVPRTNSTPPDRPSPASAEQVAEWLNTARAARSGHVGSVEWLRSNVDDVVIALAAALAAERAENERLRKLLRKAESNLDADKNRMLLNEIGTALLPAP